MSDDRQLADFAGYDGIGDGYGGGDYDWRRYAPSTASYGPQHYGAYDNPNLGGYSDDYRYGRRQVPPRYGARPRYSPWYDDYEQEEVASYARRQGRRNKTMEFLKNIAGSVLVAVFAGLIIRSIERSIVKYKEKQLAAKEKAAEIADETLNKYFPAN